MTFLGLLILLALLKFNSVRAESFTPLALQGDCAAPVAYTVGEQYVDSGNGVPDNSWSMLTRWQGIKSHQSFVECAYGEININTWQIPHRDVIGGGFNDMFGYSWSLDSAPPAFGNSGKYDLVVQAHDFYVSKHLVSLGVGPRSLLPFTNVTFYAYLVDMRHPTLHPIAIIGLVQGSQPFGDPNSVNGSVSTDYPNGVWFSSFVPNRDGPYNTATYNSPVEKIADNSWISLVPRSNFYRMMVSPKNWGQTVRDINSISCSGCPTSGYSEDSNDYKLKYAGVIVEVTLWDGPMDGSTNDKRKDQLNTTVQWKSLGIYHRLP